MKKISTRKKNRVIKLRALGLSYGKIAKELRISKSSAQTIFKEAKEELAKKAEPDPAAPVEARFLKPYPNPRLIAIYFGERRDLKIAKCVIQPRDGWVPNQRVMVVKVESKDGELYRLA